MRGEHNPDQILRSFLRGFLNLDPIACGLEAQVQEPVLEANDIQGNILAGFQKSNQSLVCLEIVDSGLAKAWLRLSEPWIATMEEVAVFNRLHKGIKRRRGRNAGAVLSTWVNIAFSYPGIRKLSPDAERFTERAFREGMAARSTLLGDPADETAGGHVTNWVIGTPDQPPDILVIVASDSELRLQEEVEAVEASLNDGLRIMFRQEGRAPPRPFAAREHFGFRDGVSQPEVRGRLSGAPRDYLAPRRNPADPNEGEPGKERLWPGEFVFGYPRQDPVDPSRPGLIAEAGPEWARNGSFLVFRRFRQDVEKFRDFLQSTAERLRREYPEMADLSAEKLGAKLMGRWPSGAPIMRAREQDIPEIAENSCTDNHFLFSVPSTPIRGESPEDCSDDLFPQSPGDREGVICPHAAHIRKANPRDDLATRGGLAAVQTHRLLRRGIPYSDPPESGGEQGLLFLAYQTSFERQFEFITRHWLNDPDFHTTSAGHDPICGQSGPGAQRGRTFTLPFRRQDGTVGKMVLELPDDWAIPTGGGYFFAPSISALRFLSR